MPNARRIPAAICFDVEDIIEPETDDAALWLADVTGEFGLTATFLLVGEKVRLWHRRGRQDVIEAVKKHDFGFHSTWHSVHPTTTESCLECNFEQGIEALRANDQQGWSDAERVMGRPLLGWACTGSSWSPSVMGLMGQMGRAYMYSAVHLPGHNVCWYAGCLGFWDDGAGGIDETLYDDQAFSARLDAVKAGIDAFAESPRSKTGYLCIFPGHPTRVVSTKFWDADNFSDGRNPPRSEWKPAPLRDRSLIPVMQANYRRLMETLSTDSRLEIVGWSELIRRFDGQKPFAPQSELAEIAGRVVGERRVLFTDHFTAAEILLLFCRAVTAPQDRYPRTFAYGPLTMPDLTPARGLSRAEIAEAASAVLNTAGTGYGYLPAVVRAGGADVDIATFFIALAHAVLEREPESVTALLPYPEEAEEIARHVSRALPGWVIHPRDMDLSLLLEQTKLQCWALKPALERA